MSNPNGANVVFPGFHWDSLGPDLTRWNMGLCIINHPSDIPKARLYLPNATIGLRLMDGGTDNRYQTEHTVEQWLAKWIPYFPILKEYDIHAVTGNEPSGEGANLTTVINFETTLAYVLAEAGIGGMFCRFSVGHPEEGRERELLPLADAIRAYEKHGYMTNEYWLNTHPPWAQPWHVGRIGWLFNEVGPMRAWIGEISGNTPMPGKPTKHDSASGFRKSYGVGIENIRRFARDQGEVWDRVYAPINRKHGGNYIEGTAVFLVGGAANQSGQNIALNRQEWDAYVDAMAAYRPAPVIDEPDDEDTLPIEVTPIPIEDEEKDPMKKSTIILTIAIMALLLLVGGVLTVLAGVPGTGVGELLAQAEPVVRETGPTDLMTAGQANLLFDSGVNAVAVGAGGSILLLVIVQMLKLVSQLANVKAADLSTATAFVLVLLGTIANQSGYSDTFDSSAALLQNILPPLLTVITAVLASGGLFNLAQRTLGAQSKAAGSRSA